MQKVDITVDRDAVAISDAEKPRLFVGNLILMRCTLLDSAGSAIVLPADNEFYASLDTDYGPSHTDLVVADDDDFNDTDDWADADPTVGKICFQLSTDETAIETALSTDRRKVIHLEIWTRPSGGSAWELLLHESVVIYNVSADLS